MKKVFKDGRLVNAAQVMRALDQNVRNQAIRDAKNVVDIRHIHKSLA